MKNPIQLEPQGQFEMHKRVPKGPNTPTHILNFHLPLLNEVITRMRRRGKSCGLKEKRKR